MPFIFLINSQNFFAQERFQSFVYHNCCAYFQQFDICLSILAFFSLTDEHFSFLCNHNCRSFPLFKHSFPWLRVPYVNCSYHLNNKAECEFRSSGFTGSLYTTLSPNLPQRPSAYLLIRYPSPNYIPVSICPF